MYQFLQTTAAESNVAINGVHTGLNDGIDLGSNNFSNIKKQKVAMLVGDGISGNDSGEIWHLLDQRFDMAITRLDMSYFTKIDIRIGTILEAEKVAKTKKLLQLKVDVGIDVRTIVSGIAESFSPEEIIGQQVSVLTNLAPRKIRGVESNGMILMTETPDGKLAFVAPKKEVKNGQEIS